MNSNTNAPIPEIIWTNCAEEMPPEKQKTIFRRVDKNKFLFTKNVVDDHSLIHYLKDIKLIQWTPYTDEKWNELTK